MEGWKDGGWWRRGMSETMNLSDASPAIWDLRRSNHFFSVRLAPNNTP